MTFTFYLQTLHLLKNPFIMGETHTITLYSTTSEAEQVDPRALFYGCTAAPVDTLVPPSSSSMSLRYPWQLHICNVIQMTFSQSNEPSLLDPSSPIQSVNVLVDIMKGFTSKLHKHDDRAKTGTSWLQYVQV